MSDSVTPWTAALQASLSITNPQSLPKLMSIELVMPSNHLILCRPPPALNLSQHQGLFQWVSASHQVPIVSGSASVLPVNIQGWFPLGWIYLISFRIDWFNLLAVQGALKNLLQHHFSKASVLQCSAFLMGKLSHPYMTPGKTIALTVWTFVGKVMSVFEYAV